MNKALSALLVLVFVASMAIIPLPGILWWRSHLDFAWRDELTLVFVALAVEKVWSMVFRVRSRSRPTVVQDWTSVSVGVSYTMLGYGCLFEFHASQGAGVAPASASAAGITYAGAVALRYWAFRHLGHQWAIHLDETIADRRLVTSGPYRFSRHPLYLGACLEAVSLPVLLGTWWSLLFAAAVFVPLEVQRAHFEERFTRGVFGSQYDEYAARTWGFLPLWRKKLRTTPPPR